MTAQQGNCSRVTLSQLIPVIRSSLRWEKNNPKDPPPHDVVFVPLDAHENKKMSVSDVRRTNDRS